MKRTLNFLMSVLIFVVGHSCDEEEVGQTPVDGIAPSAVESFEVTNTNGGAIITYKAPKDDDLAYIKAVYEVNGVTRDVRASVYSNTLEIKGYGDTNEHRVQIYAVDKSKNESSAVSITIKPLKAPVQLIRETLKLKSDFGGVRLYWENVLEEEVVISFVAANSEGIIFQADDVYTKDAQGSYALRGFNTDKRLFGAYVRDRYDNFSDTIKGEFVPLYETKLDKKKFKNLQLPGDATVGWGGYNYKMWDDDPWTVYHSPGNEGIPVTTTIDMGTLAKLSRYKYWCMQKDERLYAHQNARLWEIWGSANPNPDGSYDESWVKLLDCEDIKPSGLPVGENSNEDVQKARNGLEFEFDPNSPPVRYIRFKMIENWSRADMLHIGELTFYGKVEDGEAVESEKK